ncbi:MAG: iron-siderophore ABC transporter substrate-binding protein [Chloroflexota bacterium]
MFRLYCALFALMIGLVACAQPSAEVSPTSVSEPSVDEVPTTVGEPTDITDSAEGGDSRTITHALGETEVPANPEHIIALEWSYVENVLALGIQPVGVADVAGYNDWVNIPVELSDEVVDVGTRQEPNLETIASLTPDLIITDALRASEMYDELSEIAPTIVFNSYPTDESITQYDDMRDTFLTIADVVGQPEAGDAVLAEMEAAFATAQEELEAAGKLGEPFVLAQAFGEDTVDIRLFTDNAMAVQIMEQIGLENAWDDGFQQFGFTTVGIETLPDLGNSNFLYVVQDDNNVFERDAIQPIWESLEFVQNERVYALGGDTWLFGGPLSAEVLVDIVMDTIVGEVAASDSTAGQCADEERAFASDLVISPDCLPDAPVRIVTLDPFYSLQMSLELGLPVIGSGTFGAENDFPTALTSSEVADIEFVGTFEQPNLETIALLEPDLIIGDAFFQEENYDLLSEIAPTVLVNTPNWKQWFSTIAEVAGVSERAEEEMAAYDERVAAIQGQLRDIQVSFVRMTPEGFQMYREAPNAYAPISVMMDVGVERPEFEVGTDETSFEQLSFEGLTNVTGDVLLYVAGGANDNVEAAQVEEEVTSNPIWQQLPAVEADEAYRVNAEHWMSFGGMRSANAVLDDIEQYLTE